MAELNNTYAKVFGIATESLAKLLKVNVDDVQVITEQEYIEAVGDDGNDE